MLNFLLSTTLILATPSGAYASASHEKNYSICYGQLMGRVLPADDMRLAKVVAGELTSAEACGQLIDSLKPSSIKAKDSLSLQLLRRLNKLHSTFFTNNDFYADDYQFTMADLYDVEAAAYAFTYNFLQDRKFSKILHGREQLKARRESTAKACCFWTPRMVGDNTPLNFKKWLDGSVTEVPLIERGELMGIEPDQDLSLLPNIARVHQGGGLIGLPEFIILNLKYKKDNNTTQSFRRYGERIVKDLLCRELPVLEEKDVAALVEPESQLPFRKEAKCMACHATMDPMGRAISHLVVQQTSTDKKFFQFDYLRETHPAEETIFRYRTLAGDLIETKVTGPEELGAALSKLDDFYRCTTKRYLQFAGVKDSPDSKMELALAKRFKEHQSLRQLLKDAYTTRFDSEKQTPVLSSTGGGHP